uniref:BTB/POZ KCTD-like domain-containing protein n=1 Tax=Clandestinovirus TaxID=2831644 RepID=A0A8F8PKA9_9VIRU|nr:BTB/POZ KCTD-like domain-containing protein [Clandestinovirus]
MSNIKTDERIWINVGGQYFETTTVTLSKAGNLSVFNGMLNPAFEQKRTKDNAAFFDRDPELFGRLLNWMRSGFVRVWDELDRAMLMHECEFFGMETMSKCVEDMPVQTNPKVYSQSRSLGFPKHK